MTIFAMPSTDKLILNALMGMVLILAWLCARMGLGRDVRIRDADEARRLADEALCGFAASEVDLDRAGIGALLRDEDGRIMLLRRHGARFVARLLDGHGLCRLDRNFLTIETREAAFGKVTLDLGPQAQTWASRLRHLEN